MSAEARSAWVFWPGGPLCRRDTVHDGHYIQQFVGQTLWRDGWCAGVTGGSTPATIKAAPNSAPLSGGAS